MRLTPKQSLLALLLTVTGYSSPAWAQSEDPLVASVRKAGEVKVALASLPPFMEVSPTGAAKGSSVDWQRLVLKEMGLPPLKAVLTEWSAMIPGLLANQFDYVGAGFNITEETCKAVVFSTPTYAAQVGVYVRPGNPKKLTSVAEIARHPDIKIAAIRTSAQYDYVVKQGIKSEQITLVPDPPAAIATVTGGRVDAFILGQFTVPNPEQKGLELIVDKSSPVYASGMAFRKANAQFRDAFNKQFLTLLKNGQFRETLNQYGLGAFGDAQVELLSKFTKASDLVPGCD